MKPKSFLQAALLGLVLALLLATAASAAPGPAEFPTGTFQTFVGRTQFTITLAADGDYKVSVNRALIVDGQHSVENDVLTLVDHSGPGACLGQIEILGRYTWSFDGRQLTLSLIEDPCAGRRALAASPWTSATPALTH
ncbi:MAG: hypothetical protein ACREUU_20985 [Gammaproteobacteria bacterium]